MERRKQSSAGSRSLNFGIAVFAACLLGAIAAVWISSPGAGAAQQDWQGMDSVSTGSAYSAARLATEPNGDTLMAWEDNRSGEVSTQTRLADGSFGPPEVAFKNPRPFAHLQDLVIGADGTAVMLFEGYGLVSVRPPGGEFGDLEKPSGMIVDGVTSPQVAAGPDGTVIATWLDEEREWVPTGGRGSGYYKVIRSEVRASIRPPGGNFGIPFLVSDGLGIVESSPSIRFNSSSTATVVWSQKYGSGSPTIKVSDRPQNGGFGTPATISDSSGASGSPRVEIDSDDETVVLWQETAGTAHAIRAASRPEGGIFGTPTEVSGGHGGFQLSTGVGPDGTIAATWVGPDSVGGTVWVAARRPGQGFGAVSEVSDLNAVTNPQVGVSADGTITSAFQQQSEVPIKFYVASGTAGGLFEAPVMVPPSSLNLGYDQLLVNPAGSALISYLVGSDRGTTVNLAVRPPGGEFDEPIDLAKPGFSGEPVLDMGGDGLAVAAWPQSAKADFDVSTIEATVRYEGWGGFYRPTQTLSPTGSLPSAPVVAAGPVDDAAVAWGDSAGPENTIGVAVKVPGQAAFDAPLRVSEPGIDYLDPQVGLGENGELTLLWVARTKTGETEWTVMTSTRPRNGQFSQPVPISEPTPYGIEAPRLAVAANGAAVVTWQHSIPGAADEIYATVRDAGDTFGQARSISTPGQEAASPAVDISETGSATVAWKVSFNGQNPLIRAASTDRSGDFAAPVDVARTDPLPGPPSLAVGPDGSATVVWASETPDSPPSSVWAATGSAGSAFSTPVKLSPSGEYATGPSVSTGSDGTTTAVWAQSEVGVAASTRDPGGDFKPVTELPGGKFAGDPKIAVGPAGEAVSIWRSQYMILGAWAPGVSVCRAATLRFRSFTKNKRHGRGSLAVKASGSGRVYVTNSRQIRTTKTKVSANGKGRLMIKAKGKAARKLNRNGRVRASFKVTFRPSDGCRTVMKTKRVTLVKR